MTLENKLNEEKAQKELEESSKERDAQDKAKLFYGLTSGAISTGMSITYGLMSSYEPDIAFCFSTLYTAGGWIVSYTIGETLSKFPTFYNWLKD